MKIFQFNCKTPVKKQVDDFAAQAKEGLETFGQKVKEGFNNLFGGLVEKIQGNN